MKALFVFLVLICSQVVAEELSACGLCTMVVNALEQKSKSTRDQWIQELLVASDEICFATVQMFATSVQCKSYIELNAPYMVDLLLAEANPDSICTTLGACGDGEDYKLVFPIINEYQITYEVQEKDISQESYFRYKLFLGNPSFIHNETYHLAVELSHAKDCEVNLKVTNKTTFVQSESCSHEKNCSMDISKPGRGVWYYVTVHVKVQGVNASFLLNATEKNETVGYWIRITRHSFNGPRFAFILCLTFSTLILLCWCISRCIFIRRRYKRQLQQPYLPIMMQPVPETMIPMTSVHDFASQQFDPDSSPVLIMYPQPITNAYFAEQQ